MAIRNHNIHIFKHELELVELATTWLGECQRQKAKSVYLPAGASALPLYKAWNSSESQCLKGIKLVQVDDITEGPKTGEFKKFFETHLSKHTGAFHWIHEDFFQADVAILGLGLNGHVGFHEPHIKRDFLYGPVVLEESTCRRLGTPFKTPGLTYGLGAFMQCKSILLILRGVDKMVVAKRTLQRDPLLPASSLIDHGNLKILVDSELENMLNP